MEQLEEDEFFDSEAGQSVSLDEDEEDDDPKGSAFLRGVDEAGQIREAPEKEEEADDDETF
ncbi:MAG: hypothetical protein V1729_03550 [Candidatus Woesearchaeota archaeon]